MSESADFYMSWQGCGAFGASAYKFRDIEPPVFNPVNDVSGCQFWFDANNSDSITYDSLLQVSSWSNLGLAGGTFDASGGIVSYGSLNSKVNGLNTVSFDQDSFLSGVFTMDFQARSVFIVVRETSHPYNTPSPWLTSDASGGMELFAQYDGSGVYFLGKHPSPFPELAVETSTDYTGTAACFTFINATDLSNNWFGINATQYPPIYDAIAQNYNTSAITYFLGNYLNGTPVPATQDMCELIIYDHDLNSFEREEVIKYLIRKWNLQEPNPPTYNLIGEWDFNNYVSGDPVITNTIAGGDATINLYSSCTFDDTNMGNYYLTIYAPDNYPSDTGGITLPSLSNVSAVEVWVQYVDDGFQTYGTYFIDARTGATGGYWITSGGSTGDTIGSYFTNAKIYFNTVQYTADTTAGQPTIGPILLNNGWNQVVIVPETPITDDIALFMRYTGNQGMPLQVADIAAYENPVSALDVITIFNSKCSRYGLTPI